MKTIDASLPEPDETAKAHSEQLISCIHAQLQGGAMSFAEYMQMALYEPGLGYYMAGAQKFGASGDFITAPEVSALFGQSLAVQCREVLTTLGEGSVLELGAGSGRLALSLLASLSDAPPTHYFILEPSAELQHRQAQLLRENLDEALFNRIVWLDALPTDFVGVCIANEVMDALPVERFICNAGQILQVCVEGDADSGLSFSNRAAPAELQTLVAGIAKDVGARESAEMGADGSDDMAELLADGYCSEVSTLLAPWITSLSNAMKKGVVLLSDYGYPRQEYYLAERAQGTLACYYQHRFHDDVFFYPGLQDITAHVDFTRVIEAGSQAGLALLGYTSQTGFLLNCGISNLAAEQMQACTTEIEQLTLSRQIKTLTLPGEMGERFQFMALGKNYASALVGFSSQDLSHRL